VHIAELVTDVYMYIVSRCAELVVHSMLNLLKFACHFCYKIWFDWHEHGYYEWQPGLGF